MQEIFRETKAQILFHRRSWLNFPAHIHDDIELVYVKQGRGMACCDGKKEHLQAASWFLVFPNQVHYYTDFVSGEYYVLILKPSELLRFDRLFLQGTPANAAVSLIGADDDGISYLMEKAYAEFTRDGYSDVIAAYLTALFGKLLPFYPIQKTNYSQENVLKILQYCMDHYKEELTVKTVAESLHVSRSCVSHIFSDRLSMNFCDYINSLRLKEAEQLLKNRQYSVTEVAGLSGFPTIRTFNRAFLKKHGVSPSVYRKEIKSEGL